MFSTSQAILYRLNFNTTRLFQTSVAAVLSFLEHSMQQDTTCRLLQDKEVLQALIRNMDLSTVLRLFAASKTAKESLRDVLPPEMVRLVRDAAQQAGHTPREPVSGSRTSRASRGGMLQQPDLADVWKQFVYLLHKVPLLGTNYFYPEVLYLPSIPLSTAVKVIRACGLFTLPQLMSAVCAGVPGVTLWVQAYKKVTGSCPAGLHPAAESICCGTTNRNLSQVLSMEDQNGKEITAADLADLLHFALTLFDSTIGNAWGTTDLDALCRHPVAQELNADTCLSLLKAAVQARAEGAVRTLLNRLPNARYLPVNGIISLLGCASDARWPLIAHDFCQLHAAQRISSTAAYSLLQSAVQRSSPEMVTTICQDLCTQLASGLTPPLLATLLQAAVECDDERCQKLTTLVALPGANAIDAATVGRLLQVAVDCADKLGSTQKLVTLAGLPGAAAIDVATVGRLLQAVVDSADKSGSTRKLTALVALPAAAAIDGATTTRLLAAVLSSADSSTCFQNVEALAALPGARNIGVTAAVNLLGCALAMPQGISGTAGLEALSRPPDALQLDADTCLGLLRTAAQSHASACVVLLLTQLPASQELPFDSIFSLIAAVLSSADSNLAQKDVEARGAFQGARNIGLSVAVDLIHMAVKHGSYGVAVLLLQLSAAQHLMLREQGRLLQLLKAAEAAGPKAKSILQTMLQLPAAQCSDTYHVTEILRVAAQQGVDDLQAYMNVYVAQHTAEDSALSALVQTAAIAGLSRIVVAVRNTKPAARLFHDPLVDVLDSAMLEAVSDNVGMPSERLSYKVITTALKLDVAQQLPAQHLEPLLLIAAAGGYHTQDHMYKLLQLPAAQQLASHTITTVIGELICVSDAQHWASSGVVGVLLRLPAVSNIADTELSSLVRLAVSKEQWHSAARLIRLPAAASFETPLMLRAILLGLLHGFDDEDILSTLQMLDLSDLQQIVQWVAKRRSSLALWSGESATKFKSDLRAQVSQLLSYQHQANCKSLASVTLARS